MLQKINEIANSERLKTFAASAIQALYVIARVIDISNECNCCNRFLYFDNWQCVGPIILDVGIIQLIFGC
ncbi:hypothetical protein Bsph_3056 [Lysinibacillus sphaericus C3-41]|uniref:Uncharacterized protein n=1 Tax=Lysinibacillus sphaericus (strain C3-41) TaxID=444177 RepID=B1HPC5_LYSSC|nr:hypothetical protein Bsph_3056 [Lysinibacillus sphaericus C3-41]